MNKLLAILVVTGMLSGCETFPRQPAVPPVLVKKEVIKLKVPEKYLEIPEQVADIDWKTATQKTAAQWVLKMDQRMQTLEDNIGAIKEFNK